MRVWADVLDLNDVRIGTVLNIKGTTFTTALDGVGSFRLDFSATDTDTLELLQKERKVRIYVEVDGRTRTLGTGIIREDEVNEEGKATVSGPDSLDALTRRNTWLGLKYDNLPIATIAADLISRVPGWTTNVSATGNQAVRFDGVNILKALVRMASEAGVHIRPGDEPYSVDIGAFGEDTGLLALKPATITEELDGREDIVIIQNIQRKSSSRDVVNRIVPLGAGEGAAAVTLKDSSFAVPTLTMPDGKVVYYLDNQPSIETYGQSEKIATFKEIAPLANNTASKQRAADMLYQAASTWLERNAVPLETYSVTVRKARRTIKSGDKIRISYQGVVDTERGVKSFLSTNELFWVMKVTETVNESGISTALEVNTVDRYENDTAKIVVDAMEAIQVRNVSVQTYPAPFIYGGYDYIQGLQFPGGPSGYNAVKKAEYVLRIDDSFTDVTSVKLNIKTAPLFATTRQYVVGVNWWHFLQVIPGYNYPTYLRLEINGEDVTTALGGPWGGADGSPGSAVDVTVDITDYILAAPNLYQAHTIKLSAGWYSGETRVDASEPSSVNSQASNGVVFFTITGQAIGQAT